MSTKKLREKKLKVYVVLLSKTYLKKHPKAGQPTYFDIKLKNMLFNYPSWVIQNNNGPDILIEERKTHTIRGNYPLWEKRINEVIEGKAVLSVRQWTGKPYQSKQVEIALLSAKDGVGIQKLEATPLGWFIDSYDSEVTNEILAINDGLSLEDFKAWFKNYDLTEPMAIIHFTKFRY